MKKIIIHTSALFLSFAVHAQKDFTNFGNFQSHPGAIVSFYGNLVNNGAFTDNGREIYFNGSADQSISGASTFTIRHLDINTAGFTLQQNIIVGDTLELNNGPLYLNSNTLTISNSLPIAVSRINGYIVSEQTNNSGKMVWNIGNTVGVHTFPLGTVAGDYIPFTLNLTAGDIGNVTVSTYPTAGDNTPYPSTPVSVTNMHDTLGNDNSANVVDRFWHIDKDGPGGIATLLFSATSAEVGAITGLQAQRWGTGWEAPLPGQSSTATTVTVPGVSSFSTWTISGNNSVLPIELINFTARKKNKQVEINWVTASEINNDYFLVQRSKDAAAFQDIAIVESKGNSVTEKRYSSLDAEPYNGVSYYRLKQVDNDGKFSYSNVASVNFMNEKTVSVYPSPAAGTFYVNLSGMSGKEVVVIVRDIMGKEYYSTVLIAENNKEVIAIDPAGKLASGIYFVVATSDNTIYEKKLIIK